MKLVETDKAPRAIGPYSQGVVAGGFVFCSGQIAISPENNELIESDIEKQTEQCLNNLKNVLKAAGTSLENVVRTTVLLKDIKSFPKMNEVYGSFFSRHKPSRVTTEVSILPKDALVMISAVAYKPEA